MLHRFKAINVLAIEFEVKSLHGAGDVQDDFDGDPFARHSGF